MSDWIGKLGACNEYRGVPYVKICGRMTACNLCGTGWMTKACRKQHFAGKRHSSMYNKVKRLGFEKRTNFEKRLQHLGLLRWILHLTQLKYECLFLRTVSEEAVVAQLKKYELMERLSLLELAIWKSRICDGVFFKSLDELREYQVLDQTFDAAAHLQRLRVVSGSEIIIPHVLGFM